MSRVRKFELTYDSDAGVFDLPQVWRRLHSIRVVRVEAPLTYYATPATSISFREDGGAALQAALPAGSYDIDTLRAAVKVSLEAESALSGLGRTYTVLHNETTGLLTITASAGTVSIGASVILGFAAGGVGAASVTGERVAQPLGTLSHLLLTSPELAPLLVYPRPLHASTSSVPQPDLITVVPLTEPPYSLMVWEPESCPLETEKNTGPVQRVSFQLKRADTGEEVDLRGGVWSVTLEVRAEL